MRDNFAQINDSRRQLRRRSSNNAISELKELSSHLAVVCDDPRQLFKLSEQERRSYYMWPFQPVSIKSDDHLATFQKALTLGFMSMNRNGFVREKALDAMSGLPPVSVFKFALLRLQDWVPAIVAKASDIFREAAPQLSMEDWEYASSIILKLRERKLGQTIFKLASEELKRNFDAQTRIAHIKKPNPGFRELLWVTLNDEMDQFGTDIARCLRYETTPRVAASAMDTLLSSGNSNIVLEVALGHPLQSIRQRALRFMLRQSHPDLKKVVAISLSDRSRGVRDLARFIWHKKLGEDPYVFFHGDSAKKLDLQSTSGFQLGWLETANSGNASEILEFYQSTDKAKIRGAALTAYARTSDYAEGGAELLLRALQADTYSRKAANRLVRSGWAGPIATEIWQLFKKESDLRRKVSLLKLAASADRKNSLLPAIGALSNEDLEIRNAAWLIIAKWNTLPCVEPFSINQKEEGHRLSEQAICDDRSKDFLKFLIQ